MQKAAPLAVSAEKAISHTMPFAASVRHSWPAALFACALEAAAFSGSRMSTTRPAPFADAEDDNTHAPAAPASLIKSLRAILPAPSVFIFGILRDESRTYPTGAGASRAVVLRRSASGRAPANPATAALPPTTQAAPHAPPRTAYTFSAAACAEFFAPAPRPTGEQALMTYVADANRYDSASFRRCGRSGLVLPPISLGLWQNFGGADVFETGRATLRRAFDRGVTHFDLANNYGPPYGSAEENFGQILHKDFRPYRNELVISTKAGWDMWPGPYGIGGSRKYLLASLDDSLKRMGLDYVDIFYAHRPWKNCPLEETMGALAQAVHQGKALYVGISSYSPSAPARPRRS